MTEKNLEPFTNLINAISKDKDKSREDAQKMIKWKNH